MHDLIRLALLLGIAASALTLAGAVIAFWMDEHRRLTRLAWRVLGGQPDGLIIAQGRDTATAFRLAAGKILVLRDGGANALLYSLDALEGAELCIDDHVIARVARGEPRRGLDTVPKEAQQVVLRLLFDDPRHPEFALDLWLPMDEFRRQARPPNAVIQEARAWLGRAEAIMRRSRPPAAASIPIKDATVDTGVLPDAPAGPPSPLSPLEAAFDDETPPDFDEDDLDPFDAAGPAPSPPVLEPVAAEPMTAPRGKQLPLF